MDRSDEVDVFRSSKCNNQIKRSPLKPINAIVKQTPTTISESLSHQKPDHQTGLERNFARLHLLTLYNASKSNNEQKKFSSEIPDQQPIEETIDREFDVKSSAPLGIVDLNNYCLQQIVRMLPLQDIINVAGSCKRMQAVACEIFKLILPEHEIVIDCIRFPHFTINSKTIEHNSNDFPAFVKRFGEVIKRLKLVHMNHVTYNDAHQMRINMQIMNVLIKECGPYLRGMTFLRCGEQLLKHDQRFEEVTKVKFKNCILEQNDVNFLHSFPKMRKIQLIDCSVDNVRGCIATPLAQLKCLDIRVPLDGYSWSNLSFSVENIQSAIDLNPQIQSLSLCYWNEVVYDAKLLQYVAIHLPDLKKLELWHLRYTDFCSHGSLQFENVQQFTLNNSYAKIGRLDRNLSALSFPALQKFLLTGLFDTECFNFLARHKTIRKFEYVSNDLQNQYYPSNEDIISIGKILPNLSKIELSGKYLTPTGLVRFVSQFQSISVVKIRHHFFTKLIRKLFKVLCKDHGWCVTFNDSYAVPEFVMRRLVK